MKLQKYAPNVSTPRICSYLIQGDPVPLARCRFVNGRVWDSQHQVKLAIRIMLAHQHQDFPLLSGPLQLDVVFYMRMPQKAPAHQDGKLHYYKADLDNLIKMVGDACNDIIFHDDCEISVINATKKYSKDPRTEFTLTELRGI